MSCTDSHRKVASRCCLVILVWASATPLPAQQQPVVSGGLRRAPISQPEDGLREPEPAWHQTRPVDTAEAPSASLQLAQTSPTSATGTQQPAYPVVNASYQQSESSSEPLPASALAGSQPSPSQETGLSAPETPTPIASESHDQATKTTPLTPPTSHLDDSPATAGSSIQSFVSMGTSLLIVLGLFFGTIWFYRRTAQPSLGGAIPQQVVQVLGRTTIATRQQLMVVQFGSKLLLVSSVEGESQTLSEITDPAEVKRLAALCGSSDASAQSPASLFGLSRREVSA